MRDQRHRTAGTVGGRRKQSGIQTYHGAGRGVRAAKGLMLRGVVTATYVQLEDAENPYPYAPRDGQAALLVENIAAVYCDVLTYGAVTTTRTTKLHRVLVSQTRAGIHDGDVWKPRAARIDISAPQLDQRLAQPFDLDGDHVLIGFMEDNLDLPVILRALPHPRAGFGNEGLPEAGHRLRMRSADGEPDYRKHRGTFFGVDDLGNFVLDATRAHDGDYTTDGNEEPGDDATNGGVSIRLSAKSSFHVVGTDPDAANPKFDAVLADNALTVRLSNGASLSLTGKDSAAALAIGDGSVHAAVFEHLQEWWDTVAFPAVATLIDAHVHPSGMGPTGPSPTPLSAIAQAVAMLVTVKSGKLTFPDG